MIPDLFKAYRVFKENEQVFGKLVDIQLGDLSEGNVIIQAHYSSINYKDALGCTGRGKILKRFPLVAGIDVAGKVVSSKSKRFKEGDEVLITGCGLGENHDGGYSEFVRVPADWVISLPAKLSLHHSMVLGTAGFTAALCIHRLEANGQSPEMGPIVVTGASGGVGSFAINMLSSLGYEVIAVSGKTELHPKLLELGAKSVYTPETLELGDRPLEKAEYGGAIDNVGGEILSGLLRHTTLWGNIACVGLAESPHFQATVMPHILRGVSLLGISSTNCPTTLRKKLWQRLATDLKPTLIDQIATKTIPLDEKEMENTFSEMLERKTCGRYTVQCKPS